jgi:hypothetical protein
MGWDQLGPLVEQDTGKPDGKSTTTARNFGVSSRLVYGSATPWRNTHSSICFSIISGKISLILGQKAIGLTTA